MRNYVQCIAHRGGSELAPENTLAAFRNALALSVDGIELDVHMSRDGHLVVFHDNTVEKRTNGRGNILDLDFAYLRSLNAAAHFPGGWPEPQQIPTLREVLELARGRAGVYIEIKTSKRDGAQGRYPNIVETVISDVRAAGMLDQVLIMSFDWELLPLTKSLEPIVQTGALVSKDVWNSQAENALDALDALMQQVAALNCNWINIDSKLFMPDMPAIAHEHGFKLGVWTANSEHLLRQMAATGLDSVTTDRPDLCPILRK